MADLLPKLAEAEWIPGLTSPGLSAWQFFRRDSEYERAGLK